MELVVLISDFIRTITISLLIYFILLKITNYKDNNLYKFIFIVIWSINIALLYVIFDKYINPLILVSILNIGYVIIINSIVMKNEFNYVSYIISFIMAYVIFWISVLISGIALRLCIPGMDYGNLISVFIIPCVAFALVSLLFKAKRLNKGFNFLNGIKDNKNILIITIFLTTITALVYVLLQKSNSLTLNSILSVGVVLTSNNFIIWIKNQITKSYKTKMRDRTIEIQKAEIDEKNQMIEEIKDENLKLATAVHKYNHKFEALELAMKNALKLESKTEFAEEISVILKEVEETSKNFAKATEVTKNKIPETNIPGIDNMFKYLQEEARKNNISFDLKINASINSLIDNIIPKEKFEILIGDHLKDAIIAINSSEKSYKSILVILGLVDGVYEFSVYDTGIEFEIDTLLKLGKEQVTTHKDTGGSGIGFMTTFETLKECRASLVIEEYNPETTTYTKSVTIRFDGKNKYKICSYRAEKIKEQKTKRRIIIQKLK